MCVFMVNVGLSGMATMKVLRGIIRPNPKIALLTKGQFIVMSTKSYP